jgi:hypothetical protein
MSFSSAIGLWRAWEEPDGPPSLSFTMLTINADEHPLMKRFHKPEDEKRSVGILACHSHQPFSRPSGYRKKTEGFR